MFTNDSLAAMPPMPLSTKKAELFCNSEGGTLALIPNSSELASIVSALANRNVNSGVMIGNNIRYVLVTLVSATLKKNYVYPLQEVLLIIAFGGMLPKRNFKGLSLQGTPGFKNKLIQIHSQ